MTSVSQLNKLDGVTDGTVSASKVLVASSTNSLTGINDINITGSFSDGVSSLSNGVLSNIVSADIVSSEPVLTIKSNNDAGGTSTIRMVSDNGSNLGDGLEIKSLSGVTTFKTDHHTSGVFDRTIISLTGNTDIVNSKVDISGELSANKLVLADSSTIELGNSNDMTLLHDGTNGKINNSTGSLNIATENNGTAINIGILHLKYLLVII